MVTRETSPQALDRQSAEGNATAANVTATAAANKTATAATEPDNKAQKRVQFVTDAAALDPTPVGGGGDHGGVPKPVASAVARPAFTPSKTNDRATEETSSDVHSVADSSIDGGGPTEVIEYNPADPLSGVTSEDFFAEIETPTIEENSPAGQALRANAGIYVSSVGKAARAIHVQAVRKFVKRATGATKSGLVRGKPPRVPYKAQTEDQMSLTGEEGFETVVEESNSPDTIPMQHKQQHPQQYPQQHPQQQQADDSEYDKSERPDVPDSVVEGTMEAGKKVLNDVDPHDMIKLLRWRRRRSKGKSALLKSYVKGKVIDGEHELYTLSIAVMIGVRTSISKTNSIINGGPDKRWVRQEDFRAMEKYEFRPKGGSKTPPHQLAHTFKFKDYSPVVFAYLRRMYGVNEFDFLLSVCGNANFIEFISNAKSGQFFFYSSDGRYMIKTMTNAESKFLRRILPQYFRHCAENPNTTITRFFGMYRVKMYHLRRNVKFVIMNSVYYTDHPLQTFYDLKGSALGRDAKPGQTVKKDNDLRRGMPESALALPTKTRQVVRSQVEKDCEFLREMGIMDYSMLVGVHNIPADRDESIGSAGIRGMRGSVSRVRANTTEASLNAAMAAASFGPSDPASNLTEQPTSTSVRNVHQAEHVTGLLFDDDLDDDDSSYLFGSPKRPNLKHPSFNAETERKKQATIDKLYWPFHRLYDIHGYRRLQPAVCYECLKDPCTCGVHAILKGYNIPEFVPPLSERKDGGLEMDTVGLELPIKMKSPQGEQFYDGKIFYMGIIDVLQEYTSRKALESKYRKVSAHGKLDASCVSPHDYGGRFLCFFDEYSQRSPEPEAGIEMGIEEFEARTCDEKTKKL